MARLIKGYDNISRYIRWILGYDVEIRPLTKKEAKNIDAGVSADNIIYIDPYLIDHGIHRSILWHECGHIETPQSKNDTNGEIDAQVWALTEILRRGYIRLAIEVANMPEENWNFGKYLKARKRLN